MTRELLKMIKAKLIAPLFLAILVFPSVAFAKPVNQSTAEQVALNFLANEVYYTPGQPLTLVNGTTTSQGYYIFSNDNCFVIISGDDASEPILAYSTESGYNTNKVSPEVSYMLGNYSQQIKFIANNQVPATSEINTRWTNLVNNVVTENKTPPASVQNLLKTLWDQAPYYNDMCPVDNNPNDQYYNQLTVTGCVATAMAQVLKFWNYPKKGIGSNSYDDNPYGTLSMAFDTANFDWSSMSNRLVKANPAVAELMYSCGVAVDMSYGVAATGGSAASVVATGGSRGANTQKCAQTALTNYFGYDASTIKGLNASNYADTTWLNILTNEISSGRPVIYDGFDSADEGHCFVFDGYRTTAGHIMMHVNWGWSGYENGYFAVNQLNPGAGQIGSGTIGAFNIGQQAIIGIQPPPGAVAAIETPANSTGSVKVYPNPANDHLTADLSGINGTAQQINLINIQGKMVYSIIPGNNVSEITVNTANMEGGIYVLQILTDKGVVNSKVVISR